MIDRLMEAQRRAGANPAVNRAAAYLLLIILGLAFAWVAPSNRIVHVGVLVCINAILVYGLGFLYGVAGQLSVAHGALWGIGAYTTAVATLRWGWSFWACIPLAMVITAVVAGLVGYPSMRVKGHYFLIVTFAFAEMCRVTATNWRGLTNGDTGLVVAPSPGRWGPIEIVSRTQWYYFVFIVLVAAIVATDLLRYTAFGKRLAAIRENEMLAKAAGIDVTRDKVLAFMLSGLLAGAAGVFWAYYQHFVHPAQFGSKIGIELILMLLIGSSRYTLGPLAGVIVVVWLPEVLGFSPTQNEIALGVMFILIVLLMPNGVIAAAHGGLRYWARFAAARAGVAHE